MIPFRRVEFLGSFCLQIFSQNSLLWSLLPLTTLNLSKDCASQWTAPLKGLCLSMDWTSRWTAPLTELYLWSVFSTLNLQRTGPLTGLPLSMDCTSQWTGPLKGLRLSMDCSCSGLPDFLVEFFLKNLGLLDLLSRSKRSLLPMINHSYWLVNMYSTEDRVTIAWHIYMVLAVNCDKSSTLVWW